MIHNSTMHDLPYFTVILQENVELNKRIFMECNEDITLRPFSELTLKDVTPYLRELIQEEMSNCLVNKKLPPEFSGIKDSAIEHLLTQPRTIYHRTERPGKSPSLQYQVGIQL